MKSQNKEYREFGIEQEVDYCMQVKGDSMVNARIMDGDLVFIKLQEALQDGQVAVVEINGKPTLRRYFKEDGLIRLVADNPKYKPYVYPEGAQNGIRILGRAVAFQSVI